MKIRTRLSILFTLITATILLAFAIIIYFSSSNNREKEFYQLLQKEAITKANLLFEAKIDTLTLQNIYKSNREVLYEVEVAAYDKNFSLLYHDAVEIDFVKENEEMLSSILKNGNIYFTQDKWQVVGLVYTYNNEPYLITAAAYDSYGYSKLKNLLNNIVFLFIISIIFIYVAGTNFSKKALQPVSDMTQEVKKISAINLHLRIKNNNSKDEIAELANTFNEMLERLENSFDSNKQFVLNISHELRTPLSAVIADLELASDKDIAAEEYKKTIENCLSDSKKIKRLLDSLLDFAKASYDPSEIKFKQIRIDELLIDARYQVQKSNPDYKIDIQIQQEIEAESEITLLGNEYLLTVAFANMMENGCKFSNDKKCLVVVDFNHKNIKLRFFDNGIGIKNSELESIFSPFYRGENSAFAEGSGIGLSLTKKIISLHKGEIHVSSTPFKGSEFLVIFPHL